MRIGPRGAFSEILRYGLPFEPCRLAARGLISVEAIIAHVPQTGITP